MRIPRRLTLAFTPLALALLIAGCGGGGGDEPSTVASVETTETTALTKAELIEQGDAICAEVNAAVGSAAGSTSAEAGEQVVQVAGLYSGMVERLKALGPPSDESAGYSEFISSAEALSQAEENVKLAFEREEGEALATASTEVGSALSEFESSSEAFGFEKCAEAPSAPTPSSAGAESPGGAEAEAGEAEGEEVAPEEEAVEPAPEEAPPVEEGAGGGAGVGGGTEGGGGGSLGGSSGGIGPG